MICERCGYETDRHRNLIRHLKNKRVCKSKHSNISRTDLLIKIGHEVNLDNIEKEDALDYMKSLSKQFSEFYKKKYEKKIKEFEKKIKKIEDILEVVMLGNLSKKKINKGNINNFGSVNININNGINITNNADKYLNSYGNENTDYITSEYVENLLDRPESTVMNLTKHLHFNNEHPENHNIGFTSQQGKFVRVYVNGKWMVIDIENALSDIHRKSIELVRDKISDIDENTDTSDKYDIFKKINKQNKKNVLKNTQFLMRNNILDKEKIKTLNDS